VRPLSGSLASDTATLFKTLVTAHADGYWTATQSERFLLTGRASGGKFVVGISFSDRADFCGRSRHRERGWFIGDGRALETARCSRGGSALF
jgi:hypothetical protein